MRWITLLFSAAVVLYLAYSIRAFYDIFFPPSCVAGPQSRTRCVDPLSDDEYDVQLIISTRTEIRSPSNSDFFQATKIKMSNINSNSITTITVNFTLPSAVLRQNRSLFAYVFFTPSKYVQSQQLFTPQTTFDVLEISRYMVPRPETFLLIASDGTGNETIAKRNSSGNLAEPCMHLRREVNVVIVADNYSFPLDSTPVDLIGLLRHHKLTATTYRRFMRFDTLAHRERDLHPIGNKTTTELVVNYKLISIGHFRFSMQMEESMKALEALGFTEKDTDEVKGIFLDTNFALLMATLLISVVHLLFDFLAFKNDIEFWRGRRTLIGLSFSTVAWRSVSTVIIFLYLLNEHTSLLVTIPCGLSVLIEIWKCAKATKLQVGWSSGRLRVNFGARDAAERRTEEFDTQATRYLCIALVPLCLGGAVYCLLYMEFTGWYSFIITMLADGVYAFGFVFMCPQLFVNYKLKSVAHLPWRVFIYKAFNTFIDDCFAFIIQMPTAHRVACFRDDIIFVIYLFQRWIYPVDKSRVNEYGQSFEKPEETGTESKKHK